MDAKSLLGTTIADKYELLSIAGAGGMGTVFRARQIGLERIVAVKVLDPQQVSSEDSLLRFEREAKSISLLSHLHIAGFYSYGVQDNAIPYIAMEWLDGQSLTHLILSDEEVSAERAINIALQIAAALGYAHEHGIVHRDLKPANVLLLKEPEPDFVKIVDFGLARMEIALDADPQKLTKTGALLGTPQYLSPEQCMGNKADARSDIYALGCILYEILTGTRPFDAENAIALIHQHVNAELIPVSARTTKSLPEGLEQVVSKCLEKNPASRYQSMKALAEDLKTVAESQGSNLNITLSKRRRITNRKPVLLGLAALASIAAFLVFWLGNDVARCRISLSNDRSEANIIYWQEQAGKNFVSGKPELASLIESEVDRSLDSRVVKPADACDRCLNLAQRLLKKGDRHSAGRFAIQAMRLTASQPLPFVVSRVDQACAIMIKGASMKNDDLKLITELGTNHHNEFENAGKSTIFTLLIRNWQRLTVAARVNQMQLIVRGRDYADARHSPAKVVENVESTISRMRNWNGKPWDVPCHLAKLARILAEGDEESRALSRKFVSRSIRIVESMKQEGHVDLAAEEHAALLQNLSAAEHKLGDTNRAVEYASNAVRIHDSAENRLQLVKVLIAAHREKEALTVVREILRGLKNADKDLKENREAVTISVLLLKEQKKYDELLALVSQEIEQQRIDFNAAWHNGICVVLSDIDARQLDNHKQREKLIELEKEALELMTTNTDHWKERMPFRLVDSILADGDIAAVRKELPDCLLTLEQTPEAFVHCWSEMTKLMDSLRKVKDWQDYQKVYVAFRSVYILRANSKRSEDPILLIDSLIRIHTYGMSEEVDELYAKAALELRGAARDSFIGRYSDFLIIEARKSPWVFPEYERFLTKAIALEKKHSNNWPVRRQLCCQLNEALHVQHKYKQALDNMLEAEAMEKTQVVSEPSLFEIQAAIVFFSTELGDLYSAEKRLCEMVTYKKVDRPWELPRIWYVYATALEPLKRKGYTKGCAAALELTRDGFLGAAAQAKPDVKILAPVLHYLRLLKEDALVQELELAAKQHLSAAEFQELKK